MNINLNSQEPPRKRSRDQQHTSNQPTSSSSMIGGNEKGSNKDDKTSSTSVQQPPPSSATTAGVSPVTSSHNHQPQISSQANPVSATSSTAPPWSWFRRHNRQPAHHHTNHGQQPSSSSSNNVGLQSGGNPITSNPNSVTISAATGSEQSSGSSSSANANLGNSNPVDATSGMSNIPSFAAVSMVTSDTEQDEVEMSRLQAMLEARGVPSHLLGALAPRVQTLLHRTIGSSSSSKAHQLVQGLKAHGDEGQQLQTVMEMCQILVMGNEDSLAGFPVKLVVPNLIQLLNMEHNFDIMNHACRALTYMMESLPRSASVVVDAVPSFLQKLQVIQCMDVAEQSLTALEMLSRRHSRAILHARGVPACLTYLDFFSINAQRSALTIAANCCQNITSEEFKYIQDSLVTLSSHLTSTDKKCIESIVLAFSRMVEHFQNEPSILMEVAGDNLLDNLTQLLLATPSVISINTFVMIIRMMALMCQSCPELAVRLLSSDIISTIRYLLVGQKSSSNNQSMNKSMSNEMSSQNCTINASSTSLNDTNSSNSSSACKLNESVELLNRTPQELFELTSLIAELVPCLPSTGIFSVNKLISRESALQQESVTWSWRDDRGNWHRYNSADNKIIENAHRAGEEEITLITMGKTYTIDFITMQQINEETELSRPVQRVVNHSQSTSNETSADLEQSKQSTDPRAEYLTKNPNVLENFISSLFGVLYEIYSSSAGPSVRHKCLTALLRIIYYSPVDSLHRILKDHPVSSHIAAMLGSTDQRILVGAIQMASILMEKLPDIFSVYFRREGVMHQFKKLANKNASASTSTSSPNQKQEIREWMAKQAQLFESKSNSTVATNSRESMDVLSRLTCALEMLDDHMPEALQQLKMVLADGDISSFELIHSGMVSKLTKFLTHVEGDSTDGRDNRIRGFLSAFLGLPQDPRHLLLLLNEYELKLDPVPMLTLVNKLNACISQLEQFPVRVHDFVGLGGGSARGASALKFFNTHQLKCNLQRHPSCSNLRQWKGGPVKIDPLAVVQAIEKYLTVRGYAKIRDSADNSDDNSGDDMDDSMNMMMQSTGRHRLQLSIGDQVLPYNMTVYQAIRQFSNSPSLYGGLESEENDLQVVGSSNMWTETHTVYYRPYVEPQLGTSSSGGSNMSSLAAASSSTQLYSTKRTSRSQTAASNPISSTSAAPSGASDLRVNVGMHPDSSKADPSCSTKNAPTSAGNQQATSGRRYNTRNSSSSLYSSHHNRAPAVRRKVDDLWAEGRVPPVACPLDTYLTPKLSQSVTLKDPSMEIIVLLRAIFGLNRHWSWFYRDYISFNTRRVIGNAEFINTKLAAKATRQLQDPLVIMTGNLPSWLPQLAYACPFLIPFDTRQLLFYVTCFDRDRALQRLLDTTPELNNSEERVAPRLEKRKKTVNREDLFRQAEIILNELTNSKTVLEIQYENEVGTGLGPTLEFYALVSREMQCADLEMWRGEPVPASQPLMPPDDHSNMKDQASTSIIGSDSFQDDWKKSDSFVCMEESTLPDSIPRNNTANNNNIYSKSGPNKLNRGASTQNHKHQSKLSTIIPTEVPQSLAEPSKKYMYSQSGLFPMPLARNTKLGNVSRIRNRYKLLGKFMAKALMDSRMIDINFSLPFYKWLLSQEATLDLADMVDIDPTMSRSLFQMHRIAQLYNIMVSHKAKQSFGSSSGDRNRPGHSQSEGPSRGVITTAKSMDKLRQQVGQQAGSQTLISSEDIFANISPEVLTLDGCPIEDLNLDFTLPGYSSIELKKGGKYIQTKLDNLDQYVKLLRHWTLSEGVRRQMEAFKAGFESIVPLHYLRIFYPEELDSLFCGTGFQGWDVRMLMDACKTDHGFTHESIQIKYLFEILSSYNADEQRKFLQFVTGSPRLPYGGLKSLSPPLTIVRKTLEPGQNPDHFLPSVMTCVNYLKLPEYTSSEIMREKLRISGEEGRNSFHLS